MEQTSSQFRINIASEEAPKGESYIQLSYINSSSHTLVIQMETKRQLQVAELIKRNFGIVLQQEGNYIYEDALVTVTNVKVTPDLSLAKIYLSVYNTDNKQAVLLKLEDQHRRIKQLFSHRLRKHIRRIPDFAMYIDETLDEMYRIDALFERLDKENQLGSEEE